MSQTTAKADPWRLVGREKEIRDLIEFADSNKRALLAIRARKKCGKTSLVTSVLRVLTEPKTSGYQVHGQFIPIYVRMRPGQTQEALCDQILMGLKFTVENILGITKWQKYLKKFHKSLQPRKQRQLFKFTLMKYFFGPFATVLSILLVVTFSVLPSVGITLEKNRGIVAAVMVTLIALLAGMLATVVKIVQEPDLVTVQSEAPRMTQLNAVIQYLSELLRKDQKILLVLDEVQHVVDDFNEGDRNAFFDALRSVSETLYNRIKIIMTGDVYKLVETIDRYPDQPFGITSLALDPLTEEHSHKLLRVCLEEAGTQCDEELAAAVVNECKQVPGWIVVFAEQYADALKRQPDSNKQQMAEKIINRIKEEMLASDIGPLRRMERLGRKKGERREKKLPEIAEYLVKHTKVESSQLASQLRLSDQDLEKSILKLHEYGFDVMEEDGTLQLARKVAEAAQRQIIPKLKAEKSVENYEQANSLFEKSQFSDSIRLYTEAIESDPLYAAAYFNRALAYSMMNLWKNAKDDIEVVLKLEPGASDAPYLMGHIMEQQGRLEDAKKWFGIALEKKPDYTKPKDRLAELFSEEANKLSTEGKTKEAIEAISNAIALRPNDLDFHRRLLTKFTDVADISTFSKDELKRFLELFNQVSSRFPDDHELDWSRSNVLEGLGDLEGALAERTKAVQLEGRNALYHNNRGVTLFALGRYAEALEEHFIASELDPEEKLYRYNKIEDLACLERYDEAFNQIRDELDANLTDPRAWAYYAFVYAIKGDIERGLRILTDEAVKHVEQRTICDHLKSVRTKTDGWPRYYLVENEIKMVEKYITSYCQ